MEAVALLAELRALADHVPDFGSYSPTSRPHMEWLGKAHALVAKWSPMEAILFKHAADMLPMDAIRDTNIAQIVGSVHRAMATLELQLPSQVSHVFGPGAVYDFFKSFRELISSATNRIFVIDPYLDEKVFDAYLEAVPRNVAVRLLAREYSSALKPAVASFVAQTGVAVEARTSAALHDRVFFLDDRSCWVLGQSIKDAAKSKTTYLAPLAADAAQLKKTIYETIWAGASPI